MIGRNEWRVSDSWPINGMRKTTFYLRSDGDANTSKGSGRLAQEPPGMESPDNFHVQPGQPGPVTWRCDLLHRQSQRCSRLHRYIRPEQRPGVLVYTTDILQEGLELTGPMRAIVYLSSDAPDTDVTVKLTDAFPDGRSMNIQEGIKRVRYREGFDRPRLMEAGTVYAVPVDLYATSWYLPPGSPTPRSDLKLELPAFRPEP